MPHITVLDKGTQKSYKVESADASVGRDPSSTIYVDGEAAKTVSGRHARFFLADGKWYVEDAGSRNGTYVGTRKLEAATKHPVAVGDVIGLGLTGTQLLVQEAVGRSLAATMMEAPPPPTSEVVAVTSSLRQSSVADLRDAQPMPGKEARFIITAGKTRLTGQSDRITIGRALECIIRIEGEAATSVSRLHAEIVPSSGQVWIKDTASRHGTFVNGKKIEMPVVLKRGDLIAFGPVGQNFTVEEATVVAAGSTPTVARKSAGSHTPAEAYQAELPTPALPRNAFRSEDKKPPTIRATPPRDLASPKNPTRAEPSPIPAVYAAGLNRMQMTIGVVAAVAILAIVSWIAYSKGQNSSVTLQSDTVRLNTPIDSLDLTKATHDAAVARASLDSATVLTGQSTDPAARAMLDSLRRSVDAADERVRKASGRGR